MTNDEVKKGFDEIYNEFWLKYRDKQLPRESDEWERMHSQAIILMKKYSFAKETIVNLLTELDQRTRRKTNAKIKI